MMNVQELATLRALPAAGEDRAARQPGAGHGAAVAGAVLRPSAIQRDRPVRQPGLRRARRARSASRRCTSTARDDVEDALQALLAHAGPGAAARRHRHQAANVWPLVPPNHANSSMLDANPAEAIRRTCRHGRRPGEDACATGLTSAAACRRRAGARAGHGRAPRLPPACGGRRTHDGDGDWALAAGDRQYAARRRPCASNC